MQMLQSMLPPMLCYCTIHQCVSLQLCPCTIHDATMQLMPYDMLIVCTLASKKSRNLAGVSQHLSFTISILLIG